MCSREFKCHVMHMRVKVIPCSNCSWITDNGCESICFQVLEAKLLYLFVTTFKKDIMNMNKKCPAWQMVALANCYRIATLRCCRRCASMTVNCVSVVYQCISWMCISCVSMTVNVEAWSRTGIYLLAGAHCVLCECCVLCTVHCVPCALCVLCSAHCTLCECCALCTILTWRFLEWQ